MRRSPAERYIEFRLLDGIGAEELQTELAERQLDVLPVSRLDQYARQLVVPTRFAPRDRAHLASQRYLSSHGLRLLFQPDFDTRAATSLLDKPEPREFVETLLVSGADDGWVAGVQTRRGTATTARTIRLYRQYYFDLSLLTSSELGSFLAVRRGEQTETAPDSDMARAARSRATSLGPLLAVLRAGSIPSSAQLGRILRATQVTSAVSMLDSSLQGDSVSALRYATLAKLTSEVIEIVGDPGGDLQRDIRALLLGTAAEEVPHVSELGASYTTNLLGEPNSEGSVLGQ